jgi:hypothetical protein
MLDVRGRFLKNLHAVFAKANIKVYKGNAVSVSSDLFFGRLRWGFPHDGETSLSSGMVPDLGRRLNLCTYLRTSTYPLHSRLRHIHCPCRHLFVDCVRCYFVKGLSCTSASVPLNVILVGHERGPNGTTIKDLWRTT